MTQGVIGLIGNPNCGKTTLFNALTGSRQKVGNWPGVTVERKEGRFEWNGRSIKVVDLPGTYSLDAASSASLDEAIARDYVLSGEPDLIVNIVDASNLERNLYLTTQLLEMRLPLVLAVNMLDAAEEAGVRLDLERLAEGLGCPVVPMVASRGEGVDALKRTVAQGLGGARRGVALNYAPLIEDALQELVGLLAVPAKAHGMDPRWLGVKLLEGDAQAESLAPEAALDLARHHQTRIEGHLGEPADVFIAEARYTFVHELLQESMRREGLVRRSTSDRIDRLVLNRYLGIPVFLLVMYLLFVVSFNGGNIFLDFFDQTTRAIFVEGFARLLASWGSPGWLISLLAYSLGGSIQLVSTFIAPIGMTFLFLSILEDSGYMARAAFVMDRFMRRIGLPGKAFVPMIVGFGCNVPAVMATRTLEDPRERLVAALMQPFMSCSARLTVYMAFVAVFFREYGGQLVFALYVLGIVVAVLTAFILKRTALRGEASPFVMELPAYHFPTLRGTLRNTWDRLSVFLLRVGKVIIIASMIVTALASISPTGRGLGDHEVGESILAEVGKGLTPVFAPMGITQENWPATVGLLSGVVVKEIVMGTLNGVYGKMGAPADEATATTPSTSLSEQLGAAVATIPANAAAFAHGFLDPLGFGGLQRASGSLATSAEAQGLEVNTLTRLGSLFTVPAAIAYLIFILLYMPCVNTIAAIRRETGSRGWTTFAVLWGLLWAYGLAVIYYQMATFSAHPASALFWLAAVLATLAMVVVGLRRYGLRRSPATALSREA
ncbi:Fe(2+) transporter permease subunit FeoB [Acidihalobacter prosperus]|uniref:Ferrous iron transport protein B n=1 Tax=Acidihalobacter prosperus TaxID=160660 RepID=A0A1A6C1U0_9GAMM|nr:Fe(2+) transporter permease subunit FeoB [Acidihalobacter prosperus]OBS08523.1 Ferrous iron transport protein B [Acidihalobacter prosperus]